MLKLYESKNMFENRQYKELVEIGRDKTNRDEFSQWDWLNYLKSLYKLKEYLAVLDGYKEMRSKFPSFDHPKYTMCWSLYYAYLKGFDFKTGDIELYRQRIDLILSSMPQNNNNNLLLKIIVFQFCGAIMDGFIGESRDYALIESYLNKIDPEMLSKSEGVSKDGIPLASDYEKWYSYMAKALLEQQKYDECIECCNKALDTISKFHYNNNIWFNYRKAKSLRALNKEAEGTAIINEALSGRFSHWCLYEYLFDNAVSADDEKSANIYGAKCATADREHKMRVTFYQKYAEFLENHDNIREAMLLHQLIILVRQEEGWNEKSYFADWNISDEVKQMSKEDILKELNAFWRKLADSDKLEGYITKILPNGSSGFISDNDGNSYYFSARDFKANKTKMAEGQRVKFNLVDGFDKKKNIKTKNAISITLQ